LAFQGIGEREEHGAGWWAQVLPVAELAKVLGMLHGDADGRTKIILEN